MSTSHVNPPPLWELEVAVIRIISERQAIPVDQIRPESRTLEDLHIDSMDMVELILELEEQFAVSIPDDLGKRMFLRDPMTVAGLAEIVRHQWGTGIPPRRDWRGRPLPPVQGHAYPGTPFTQWDGCHDSLQKVRLDSASPTSGGHAQFRRSTDGMRCVLLPEAEVELGSDAGAPDDEQPRHRARISAFLMDAEPVSVTAFARFLNSVGAVANPHAPRWFGVGPGDRRDAHVQIRQSPRRRWEVRTGTEHQPMILVSWFGAAAYSLWAGGRDWAHYETESLLPTEAQWEYAARGAAAREFPWGDAADVESRARVGLHRHRRSYPDLLPLAPVQASLGMSPWDLHHMAGNVWHWCHDWYAPEFYRRPEASLANPVQQTPTGIRSERGGSWVGPGALARCSYRRGRPPEAVGRCLGFRCALPASFLA
ncbi:MAG: SUMF1/EgtB/PvdO family nonheme iron enzyme [Verrucomicrobia bacterium]|nr:SUMF1/EgtB/PvdO family nonheme iron enzyme [Verrucomicrobiota bacterium]